MRFFASIVSIGLLLAPDGASALTTCPISQFMITFDEDEASLDPEDMETLAAGSARTRQCHLDRLELIAEGDLESEQSLSKRRVTVVRDELVQNGIGADLIHAVNVSSEHYGTRTSPTQDAVTIMIFFD